MPYALLGPGFVLDDWFALANARFDGWWMAAGREQWLARPGAGAAYALVFGLIGRRPLAVYAVSVALVVVAAVLLRRLLVATGVRRGVALAVALVWLALPNHGSLAYWPSAVNITLALVLLLGGLLALAAAATRWAVLAPLLLAASVLCYEATGPVAVAGVLALFRRGGRGGWRRAWPSLAAMAAAGAWMVVFFHPAKRGIDEWADLTLALPAHAGWGVLSPRWLATVGGLAFVVGVVLVTVAAVRRPSLSVGVGREAHWLVLGGIAVVVLGTLPFVRYFYAPLGAGDRVNVVASVGSAMAWTGLGAIVWERARWRAPAVVMACALAFGVGLTQWRSANAWAAAADDANTILARLPARPTGVVVVEQPPIRRNVTAFLDHSNIAWAVQLEAGTRDVDARLVDP